MRRTYSIIFACLLAIVSSGVNATDATNCAAVAVNSTAFFNLCPFAQLNPFSVTNSTTEDTVEFTLGIGREPSCEVKGTNVWATLRNEQDCVDLAVVGPSFSFINTDDENSGLAMAFPIHDNHVSTENRSLIVWLHCNASETNISNTTFYFMEVNDTTVWVQANSSHGCSYISLNKLLKFLEDNKYPFIGASVVLGFFVLLFGLRMFRPTVFLITATAATLGSGMLFFEFTKFGTQQWILWIIFGTCLIIGCVLGYLAILYEKLGFFAIGGGLGVVGGFFVYNTILSHFLTGHTYILYLVVGVCALAGGGLALWLWKDIIIIASSIIGAYMIIRAISILIGGFPNEFAVAAGVVKLGAYAYIYLGIILVLSLGGMYYQFREKRLREEDEGDEDDYVSIDRKNKDKSK